MLSFKMGVGQIPFVRPSEASHAGAEGLVGWFNWVGRTSFSANGNGMENGNLGISCPSPNADPGNENAHGCFFNHVL